jgi:helicase
VARLLQAGLAELDGELVHLTLLGRACGASSLSFESSLRLIELMRQLNVTQVDPVQVLGTIEVLAQMDGIYTPVMKRGRSESVRAGDVAQRYGHAMAQGLQRYCRDELSSGHDASVHRSCSTGSRTTPFMELEDRSPLARRLTAALT